jgi:hypothetical protein
MEPLVDGTKAIISPTAHGHEHLVRRLGWAVVHVWPGLNDDIREQILRRALLTADEKLAKQLNVKIAIFLREHAKSEQD